MQHYVVIFACVADSEGGSEDTGRLPKVGKLLAEEEQGQVSGQADSSAPLRKSFGDLTKSARRLLPVSFRQRPLQQQYQGPAKAQPDGQANGHADGQVNGPPKEHCLPPRHQNDTAGMFVV